MIPKVREIGWSGPQIPMEISILCIAVYADHQMILSGPRTGKAWEPLH